ncbi:MAG: hypothetical protein Q4G45_12445 [Actinomycetia bacterium]|nr:hypothetical protein [Actinomycetes bacterium]
MNTLVLRLVGHIVAVLTSDRGDESVSKVIWIAATAVVATSLVAVFTTIVNGWMAKVPR